LAWTQFSAISQLTEVRDYIGRNERSI
jgi:hypothetical protein